MENPDEKKRELPDGFRKAQSKALQEDAEDRPKRRRIDKPNPFSRGAGGPP